jgi:hypothetical protein
MIFGSSQGFIDIKMTRWDNNSQTRVTVASAHLVLSGMDMVWTPFSIPLIYSDWQNPDTCILVMTASGSAPAVSDYLYVDDLQFTGTVTGIAENGMTATISVYPNPANETIGIGFSRLGDQSVSLKIVDALGREVIFLPEVKVSDPIRIGISELPAGHYLLLVNTSKGRITKTFARE